MNPALSADQGNKVESGTGVEYDGTGNPGAIFAADDAGSFGGALLGAALTHPAAILGNGTTHVNNGVYGNTAHPTSATVWSGATASRGRGGVLTGNAAQLKLVPGSKSSHPSSGQRGNLYADSKGRLWFCKGGTSWHQLA